MFPVSEVHHGAGGRRFEEGDEGGGEKADRVENGKVESSRGQEGAEDPDGEKPDQVRRQHAALPVKPVHKRAQEGPEEDHG